MPEMVWCERCKTVVWAYDHQPPTDLRGTMNMLDMPCPECGETACFDGWACRREDVLRLMEEHPNDIYDGWSALRYLAKIYKVEWKPSPNNKWWKRPDRKGEPFTGRDLTEAISALVRNEGGVRILGGK